VTPPLNRPRRDDTQCEITDFIAVHRAAEDGDKRCDINPGHLRINREWTPDVVLHRDGHGDGPDGCGQQKGSIEKKAWMVHSRSQSP
jgi:hypothetical protein